MGEFVVIFNPAAGGRRQRLQRVLAGLAARNVRVRVEQTTAVGDARRFAADLPDDTDTVVIAGGDGTINEVINGLVAGGAGRSQGVIRPDIALIPMGTANVLAREIGLTDLSPDNIAGAIVGGRLREMFVARANDRHFTQMCGVGFDAHVVASVNLRLKRRLKKFAYVLASLGQIWRYVPRTYRVAIDGRNYEAASVIVANGHYYGGRFVCATQARIDDALLYACLFGRAGRWHVVRYAWGLLSGRLKHFSDVTIVPAARIIIESVKPRAPAEPVQGDGDIIAGLPVTIVAGAARLAIRCPA